MSNSVMQVLLLTGIVVGGGAIQAPSQQRSLLTSRRNADEEQGSVSGPTTFVVNHLPKCGGLQVRGVLGEGRVQHFRMEPEQEPVTKADAKDFVVGLMRNPLDYYVSHWAFLSTEPDAGPPQTYLKKHYPHALSKCGKEGCGFNAGGKAAFNQFVKTVCTEDIGQMSLRFWGSFIGSPPNGNFHNNPVVQEYVSDPRQTAMKMNESEMTQTIKDDFENAHSLAHIPVNCWVKQENLEADLFRCLQMYEKTPGHGKVDFEAIRNKLHSNATFENSSPHASCKEMYDQDTLKMVVKADSHLFKLFGFPRHCQH